MAIILNSHVVLIDLWHADGLAQEAAMTYKDPSVFLRSSPKCDSRLHERKKTPLQSSKQWRE